MIHFCGSVITHYDTFILRLQSIVGSPRGNAASSPAQEPPSAVGLRHASLRLGVRKPLRLLRLSGGTHNPKIRYGQQSIRNTFLLIFAAHGQRAFGESLCLSISKSADFSTGTISTVTVVTIVTIVLAPFFIVTTVTIVTPWVPSASA